MTVSVIDAPFVLSFQTGAPENRLQRSHWHISTGLARDSDHHSLLRMTELAMTSSDLPSRAIRETQAGRSIPSPSLFIMIAPPVCRRVFRRLAQLRVLQFQQMSNTFTARLRQPGRLPTTTWALADLCLIDPRVTYRALPRRRPALLNPDSPRFDSS